MDIDVVSDIAWSVLFASSLRFSLARDPFSLPVMVAWALMEEELGVMPKARHLLEMAVTTEPGNPNVWEVTKCVLHVILPTTNNSTPCMLWPIHQEVTKYVLHMMKSSLCLLATPSLENSSPAYMLPGKRYICYPMIGGNLVAIFHAIIFCWLYTLHVLPHHKEITNDIKSRLLSFMAVLLYPLAVQEAANGLSCYPIVRWCYTTVRSILNTTAVFNNLFWKKYKTNSGKNSSLFFEERKQYESVDSSS